MAAKNSVHKKVKKTGPVSSAQAGAGQAAKKIKNKLVKQKTARGHKPAHKAKAVKNSKTSKAKSHYTAAQRKAYQSASRNAIKRAQLQHNAKALQQRRLQAAEKVIVKLQQKRTQAIAARIKAHAVRATYLQTAHSREAAPLRIAAAHRLFKIQSIAQNRQFAAAGEAIHARTTTLQTLTDAQALSIEQRLSAAASARARANRKTKAKKGKVVAKGKSATRKGKTSRSSPYTAAGHRAGAAAAARVHVSKPRKAPAHRPVKSTEWITAGNDCDTENCVAVAIANSLLYNFGYRVSDEQVNTLALTNRLAVGLWLTWAQNLWYPVELLRYERRSPCMVRPGDIVGFDIEGMPHCGVFAGEGKVITWGEVVSLESPIDEAWSVRWRMTG